MARCRGPLIGALLWLCGPASGATHTMLDLSGCQLALALDTWGPISTDTSVCPHLNSYQHIRCPAPHNMTFQVRCPVPVAHQSGNQRINLSINGGALVRFWGGDLVPGNWKAGSISQYLKSPGDWIRIEIHNQGYTRGMNRIDFSDMTSSLVSDLDQSGYQTPLQSKAACEAQLDAVIAAEESINPEFNTRRYAVNGINNVGSQIHYTDITGDCYVLGPGSSLSVESGEIAYFYENGQFNEALNTLIPVVLNNPGPDTLLAKQITRIRFWGGGYQGVYNGAPPSSATDPQMVSALSEYGREINATIGDAGVLEPITCRAWVWQASHLLNQDAYEDRTAGSLDVEGCVYGFGANVQTDLHNLIGDGCTSSNLSGCDQNLRYDVQDRYDLLGIEQPIVTGEQYETLDPRQYCDHDAGSAGYAPPCSTTDTPDLNELRPKYEWHAEFVDNVWGDSIAGSTGQTPGQETTTASGTGSGTTGDGSGTSGSTTSGSTTGNTTGGSTSDSGTSTAGSTSSGSSTTGGTGGTGGTTTGGTTTGGTTTGGTGDVYVTVDNSEVVQAINNLDDGVVPGIEADGAPSGLVAARIQRDALMAQLSGGVDLGGINVPSGSCTLGVSVQGSYIDLCPGPELMPVFQILASVGLVLASWTAIRVVF